MKTHTQLPQKAEVHDLELIINNIHNKPVADLRFLKGGFQWHRALSGSKAVKFYLKKGCHFFETVSSEQVRLEF